MQHLPLFADLEDRACLVVGGGPVAERRVAQLLDAGAKVAVCAPSLTPALQALADEHAISHEQGEFYERSSLDRYWLVVAATNDRAVNARVARAAEQHKRFCNVVDDEALCSFIMPAIVDRDPVTVAIASGGRSPTVSRWIKGLIETMLPLRVGSLASLAGRWRERVRAALPDPTERRRFWQHVLTSDVANHSFAGREASAERALQGLLELWRGAREAAATEHSSEAEQVAAPSGEHASTSDQSNGHRRGGEAYLVGAGPGAPDLITIRGRQLLAEADVVLYDRLVSPALLAYARRDAELISVGKTPGKPSITQKQLNRLLVRLVASGKRVCRLKGGDPMIFGRGGEELEALANAGLRFQVVPGVSAAEGCAAYAGVPLTFRGLSRAVLLATGQTHDHGADHLAAFRPGQTLALYMGVAQYAEISAELLRHGHDPETPVAIIESGTTEQQRVIRTALRSLPRVQAALEVRPPALLVVGETARFAERYSWFEPSKLERFEDDAQSLARVS